MTWSHCCWFITNIGKSDHRLNMTLGTDIKFTLSFLSAKSQRWWNWILSYFKTQKLWSEHNLNTNGSGLSSDVTLTVLCFQFHTHIGYFYIPRSAVVFKQLLNCVFLSMTYAHQNPVPSPSWYTFGNRGFNWCQELLYSTTALVQRVKISVHVQASLQDGNTG